MNPHGSPHRMRFSSEKRLPVDTHRCMVQEEGTCFRSCDVLVITSLCTWTTDWGVSGLGTGTGAGREERRREVGVQGQQKESWWCCELCWWRSHESAHGINVWNLIATQEEAQLKLGESPSDAWLYWCQYLDRDNILLACIIWPLGELGQSVWEVSLWLLTHLCGSVIISMFGVKLGP